MSGAYRIGGRLGIALRMPTYLAASLALLAAAAPGPDYAKALLGKRLIMKDASCAGLAFTGKGTVAFYAEMECSHGHAPTVEARVRWLTRDTFLTTETTRINKDCPPRNWLYKVESLTAKTARLREVWTGWNEFPDSVLEYKVTSANEDEP